MALPLFRGGPGPNLAAILGGDSPQVGWFPGSGPPQPWLRGAELDAAPARTLVVHFHEYLSATH